MKNNITDYLNKMNGNPTNNTSHENEWQYNRSLIEASLDAFVTLDQNGIVKDVNKAAEAITGITRNQLIESEFIKCFAEPQNAQKAYKQALLEGKVYNFELNVKHVNGSTTPVLLNASTFTNSENEVIGVLCTIRDVTSTLKIEDELIHLKNSLEQFVKQRAAELSTANIELAFQNEEKYKRASELVLANKEIAHQSEENEIYEMQTNILKEQNVILEKQKIQLDEATHLKSSFLSNMSHELRTPLNAIVGFTDLTLKTDLSTKQLNYLSKIKVLSQTLLGLISDILDLSKIEAGKLELEMAIFDLGEVMKNAENQVATKIQEKGLTLNCSIDEDVPMNLRGDSLRLGQIINNLVSNAVKFTAKGSVDIHVKMLENDGNDVVLEFSVRDTGIGMSESQINKLFQPFIQADSSTSRKYGGTGLGLSISQQLINLMHGQIWVTSVPDEGSTFYFTIKIETADKLRQKHFNNESDKWDIKVLVVDSQTEDREIIGKILTEMTLDVTLCSSGKEALTLLKSASDNLPYDLVIMDLKTNDMDGIDTAKHIKQQFAFKKAPKIILMTSNLNQEVQDKTEQIGLHEGVLHKPVTGSLLFNSIIQVCFNDDFDQVRGIIENKNVANSVPYLQNAKLLLVEDNEINREVAQEVLQEAGLEVTLANNGQEALDLIENKVFDVILMDIQMPIMDGYEATREIRKNDAYKDLPIIAMTANALLSDQIDCYKAGMNDHISKPIDINQLFYTLALWVKNESLDGNERMRKSNLSDKTELQKIISLEMDPPGIDIVSGLNRLGGNEKLYLKLLDKFHKNHKHDIEEIHYALKQDDIKMASRLVHSLKGAAGNLSIHDVYLDSDTLETAFKINKLNFVDLLIEKLEQSLNQSFNSITTILNSIANPPDNTSIEDDSFQLLTQMNLLEALLDDHDIEALECIDNIVKHATGYAFLEKALSLKMIIDQYDYDQADVVFEELNQMIRKELNHG